MLKDRWFLYTVLVGLIPTICRLFLFALVKSATANFILNESDFIGLGLVLNLANLNEIEGKDFLDKQWVFWRRGLSFILLFICALLLTTSMVQDLMSKSSPKAEFFDMQTLKVLSIVLCVSSLLYGYSTFAYLNKAKPSNE